MNFVIFEEINDVIFQILLSFTVISLGFTSFSYFTRLVDFKKKYFYLSLGLLFLNTRIISAEEVTNNAKIAELELKKINKTGEVISQMKTNENKANLTEENEEKNNTQQIENLNLADNIKYSTVDIYIKEPKVRIAEITITNTQFYDNKYQVNFFYEAKSSLLNGFYFVQKFFVFLLNFWPLFVGILIVIYFVKYSLTTIVFPKKTSKSENIEK